MSQNDLILTAISELKDDLKADIVGVHTRLDTLNGRTRSLETKVAVQWAFWGIVGAAVTMFLPALVEAFLP